MKKPDSYIIEPNSFKSFSQKIVNKNLKHRMWTPRLPYKSITTFYRSGMEGEMLTEVWDHGKNKE